MHLAHHSVIGFDNLAHVHTSGSCAFCRVLALSTLTAVGATWLTHRRTALPAQSRRWLNGLMAVTAAQVQSEHGVDKLVSGGTVF